MRQSEPIKYPIKAAMRLTGLTAETLRAWERRYQAISPEHTLGGRLYLKEDIDRLKLLKSAVNSGHRIGKIANLPNEELLTIVPQSTPSVHDEQIDYIVSLIQEYNPNAEMELSRLAGLMQPRAFVFDIVLPLMKKVGQLWQEKKLTIAQEHFASAAIRSIFGTLIRLFKTAPESPSMVFGTLTGEEHEFGVKIAAMIAIINGIRPIYLGISLPCEELVEATVKSRSAALVTSVNQSKGQGFWKGIVQLRNDLPDHVDLIVGTSPENQPKSLVKGISVLTSLEKFEMVLANYRNNP